MPNYQLKPDIARNSPEGRAALLKAINRVQEEWAMNNAEFARLIHVNASTLGNWKKNEEVPGTQVPMSPDVERVVTLLAIHRSLSAMFASRSDQLIWLTSGHPDLNGKNPKDFIAESSRNLFWIRAYLDYVRGRGA